MPEILESFCCLQIRVSFSNNHQPAESALQLPLCLLKLLQRGGVVYVNRYTCCFLPLLPALLLVWIFQNWQTLYGFNNTVVQVCPALIIGLNIAPYFLYILVTSYQAIITAAAAATQYK